MTLERVLDAVVTSAAVIVIGLALAVGTGVVQADHSDDGILMSDATAEQFAEFMVEACKENGVVFITAYVNGDPYVLPIYCKVGNMYSPNKTAPLQKGEDGFIPEGTWL